MSTNEALHVLREEINDMENHYKGQIKILETSRTNLQKDLDSAKDAIRALEWYIDELLEKIEELSGEKKLAEKFNPVMYREDKINKYMADRLMDFSATQDACSGLINDLALHLNPISLRKP